jgi:peptidoglycan-associated lipoprotein
MRTMTTASKWVVFLATTGALCITGCAKQQVVKKDEIAPPAAATKPAEAAAKPSLPEVPVKKAAVDMRNISKSAVADDVHLRTSLDKVFFAFDSSALSTAARDTLAKNAAYLKKNAGVNVRIEGNCDERGSDEYNLALGEKRAKEAKQYLVALGIAAERLTTISYGKEQPAVPGQDEAAWAKDRRDEFVVLGK